MLTPEQKEFIKILESVDYSRHNWEVFQDFCEMTARTLSLPFYPGAAEKLKPLFEKYSQERLVKLDKMSGLIVDGLTNNYHDFLGGVFQEMNLASKWKGQFFTPFHVCEMMAKMQVGNLGALLKEKHYITINDCASGSGALLIAGARAMIEAGYNHSRDAYFVAQDVDQLAFYMSYIQLSLCGVAGEVIWGNTLSMEIWETLRTPVSFVDEVWQYRFMMNGLKASIVNEKINDGSAGPKATEEKQKSIGRESQLTLF